MVEFPRFVPGAMVIIDILVYADKLLAGQLFPQEPKMPQISKDAFRIKKLMGALRYLYRNSNFAEQIQLYCLCFI